jgi:hypothetical protein
MMGTGAWWEAPRRVRNVVLIARDYGEHLLKRVDGDGVYALNETARAVWELCDGETQRAEIITSITQLFRVPEAVVARDVTRVLAELQCAGLIDGVGRREDH